MSEEVQYVTNIDDFIESNNLRQLFFNLTAQLTKTQPDDPIQYLIDFLENKNHLRLIYVNGIYRNDTVSLANTLSVKFNYTLIDLFDEMKTEDIHGVDNQKINQRVQQKIKELSKNIKGAIICGYPNNHIQAEFIQKKGYFPERLFVFPTDPVVMEKYYVNQGITPNKAKLLNVRNTMNVQEVKTLFGNIVDVLPESIDGAKTICSNILKIKDITPYPLNSPRILVIHPPYIQPSAVKRLCSQFGLHFISVESSFLKYKSQKNTFREYVRKFQQFTPELELGIVRTDSTSIVAKKKGFVLSGWPNAVNKLTYLKQQYLRPHLIFAFIGEKEELEKQFVKTDANSQMFPLKPKPGLEEFRNALDDYGKLIIELKKNPKTQILTIDTSEKDFIRAFENKISNREVYK